jgi:hypothetical protein
MLFGQKSDTVKKDFIPTGIRVGTDILSIIRSSADDSFQGLETSIDVDFYRYFFTVELGNWQRNFDTDSEIYSNRGTYWRAGVDINFLKTDPEKNMLFLGARYANGTFSEVLTILVDDQWGSGPRVLTNGDAQANWVELTGGLRVKIWKFVWLGYTARYKFGLRMSGLSNLAPHDVPGYGRTDKNTTWGFNYSVLIRIPFRNTDTKVSGQSK